MKVYHSTDGRTNTACGWFYYKTTEKKLWWCRLNSPMCWITHSIYHQSKKQFGVSTWPWIPTRRAWIKAIQRGNFVGWPLVMVNNVNKYFLECKETVKGHRNDKQQGVWFKKGRMQRILTLQPQKTRKNEMSTQKSLTCGTLKEPSKLIRQG